MAPPAPEPQAYMIPAADSLRSLAPTGETPVPALCQIFLWCLHDFISFMTLKKILGGCHQILMSSFNVPHIF